MTAREVQILDLLSYGATNTEVAQRLGLSPLTVKSHLHRISERLGVSERAGLVWEAFRRGLLPLTSAEHRHGCPERMPGCPWTTMPAPVVVVSGPRRGGRVPD